MNDVSPAGFAATHQWVHRNLPAHALHLLAEDELPRVREHLEVCPICREEAAGFFSESVPPEPDSREGHLPASLLIRWPHAVDSLRGLERRMARQHLARCPECRQDLEWLGFDANLPWIAELDLPALSLAELSLRDQVEIRGEQPEFVLAAADTDSRPRAVVIPSFHGEEGRLVVTFRTNQSGLVTAHFVSEDPQRSRCRILWIGEQRFTGDWEGRADLSELSPDQVVGQRFVVPPLYAADCFDSSATELIEGERVELVSRHGSGPPVLVWIQLRGSSGVGKLRVRVEEAPAIALDLVFGFEGGATEIHPCERGRVIESARETTRARRFHLGFLERS